jgi:hypothetical protein
MTSLPSFVIAVIDATIMVATEGSKNKMKFVLEEIQQGGCSVD